MIQVNLYTLLTEMIGAVDKKMTPAEFENLFCIATGIADECVIANIRGDCPVRVSDFAREAFEKTAWCRNSDDIDDAVAWVFEVENIARKKEVEISWSTVRWAVRGVVAVYFK